MIESLTGWSRQAFGSGSSGSSVNQLNQTTSLKFRDGRYGGTVAFNYDIARSTLINQRYHRLLQRAVLRRRGSNTRRSTTRAAPTSCVPKDRRFNISFTLAGVGSFSNFFGAFGGGTYVTVVEAVHEGTDPQRGQGHAPAAADLHQRQAARAGRQQAGAVLRHRGAGRGRHHATSASSSATRRPRSGPRSATARAGARGSPTSSRTRRAVSRTRCSISEPSSAASRS